MKKYLTVPVVAAIVFVVVGAVAAASIHVLLLGFAAEAGVHPWVFIALPALTSAMVALIVYQRAEFRVKKIGDSVSRSVLVVLLTWPALTALATAAWFPTEDFFQWYSTTLLFSAVVGGGPMLAAALIAGVLLGIWLKRRNAD